MTNTNGSYIGLYSRASAFADQVSENEEPNELELLEDIELEEDVHSEINNINEPDQPHFSATANPYINSFFPVVIIDKKMKILFVNEACRTLFTGYVDFSGKYFADVFGKPFGIEDLRKIHDTIIDGQNSYFWKGEVRIKSRNVVSVQLKVFVFPVELEVKDPGEFVIMFDDITEENNKLTRSTFLGLLEASKLKDRDTGSHIIRVNYYSRRLSEELFRSKNPKYNRVDADFIDNIGFLASMHDLGKIGTPDDILNKEGPLLDWEWKIMKEHIINGGIILSSYPNKMAQEIARCHHEHWNGTGYPYQLSEDQIPLAARIVTIADVYDALRTVRSYKPAFPHEEAVKKILEGKEIQFDPFLMDIFTSVNADFNHIYDDNFDSL